MSEQEEINTYNDSPIFTAGKCNLNKLLRREHYGNFADHIFSSYSTWIFSAENLIINVQRFKIKET